MNPRRIRSPARARGMSLIEMLVAMVLGLVVLGAVGYLFIGSKTTNATQNDLLRMQESARNTMDTMGRAIRQAGYKLDVGQAMNGVSLAGTEGGGTASAPLADTLIVNHDPNWNAVPMQGREYDCAGTEVVSNNTLNETTGVTPANTNMVSYRFFIQNAKLRCSNKPADLADVGVVVANNVENLQLTYGIGAGAEVVSQYVTAPTVPQFATTSAVRVSIVVRGNTPNLVPGGSQTLTLEGTSITWNDGFLRQVYSSTFTVRNQTR